MFTVKNLAMVASSGADLLIGLGDIKQASAVIIGFDDLGTQGDTFGAFDSTVKDLVFLLLVTPFVWVLLVQLVASQVL